LASEKRSLQPCGPGPRRPGWLRLPQPCTDMEKNGKRSLEMIVDARVQGQGRTVRVACFSGPGAVTFRRRATACPLPSRAFPLSRSRMFPSPASRPFPFSCLRLFPLSRLRERVGVRASLVRPTKIALIRLPARSFAPSMALTLRAAPPCKSAILPICLPQAGEGFFLLFPQRLGPKSAAHYTTALPRRRTPAAHPSPETPP
jgi:hypothetical protein